MRLLLLSALSLVSAGCGDGDPAPKPPDLSALVAVYEHPTGVVTESLFGELTMDLNGKLKLAADARLLLFLNDDIVKHSRETVEKDEKKVEDKSHSRSSNKYHFHASAFAVVHHTCEGWSAEATQPSAENGQVSLTFLLNTQSAQAVFWGDATTCQERVENRRLLFDASLAFGLQSRVLSVSGDVRVNDRQIINGEFDARYADGVEVRHPMGDGTDVVFFNRGEEKGIRAANGVWVCANPRNCIQQEQP